MLPSGRYILIISAAHCVPLSPRVRHSIPMVQIIKHSIIICSLPCSPLRYARVSRWAGRHVINPLNLGLIDIFDLLKCECEASSELERRESSRYLRVNDQDSAVILTINSLSSLARREEETITVDSRV